MDSITKAALILCTFCYVRSEDSVSGIPFASSLSVGQAVLLPKCDAHICPNGNSTLDDASRLPMRCNCKEDCYKQRDCCLDALPDARVADLITSDLWSCVRTERGHGPYVAIGLCPAKWENPGVRKACEDVSSAEDPNRFLPVISTRTNVTYRNIYCGQCNEGELQPGHFQLRFRCSGGENVTSVPAAMAEKNCDAYIDEGSASYCTPMDRTTEDCPETWKHKNETYAKEVKWRCRSYFGPITINATRYKNAFCALCNNVSWNLEDVVCRNSYYPIEKEFMLTIDGEFNSGTLIPGAEPGKVCQPGEVFDPFKKQCRQILCVNRTDCNSTYTSWEDESLRSDSDRLPSPCNMSLLDSSKFTRDETTKKVTVQLDEKKETYSIGEYEYIESGENKGSILVCKRIGPNAIPLFPQHFCERRQLLGYGSCGCETDCIQSRSCCLDALNEETTRNLMAQGDAWICLNDSQRSSALAKCPGNFTDRQIRNACETPPDIEKDPLLYVPVFAWDSSVLYRNVFCAVCSGASNVTFFDVRIQCAEHVRAHNGLEAAEVFVSEPGVCTMFTDVGNANIPLKPCVEDPECRQCPPSWGKNEDPRQIAVRWRCEHYYAPVSINGVCYRNDFCAYCNNINPTEPSLNRTFSSHMLQEKISKPLKESISTFTVG